ncbi:MAG: DUF302 domain-containing protein [Bdellovibrionaceae bacterium]|nr:DUF302 domain-containing protein [Bdellovibrionales bacterium]MCB9253982.1 DUF302 domain-containing protein [Pseudobdellovibrionaceae bacterium]
MKLLLTLLVAGMFNAPTAWSAAGLVSVASQNDVQRTVDLLKQKAKTFGFEVVLVLDNASKTKDKKHGKLLLLDNPKHEWPLLSKSDTIGVDLPLKVLTFADKEGQVWMTYMDPRSIAARHNVSDSDEAEKLADALSSLTLVAATGKRQN